MDLLSAFNIAHFKLRFWLKYFRSYEHLFEPYQAEKILGESLNFLKQGRIHGQSVVAAGGQGQYMSGRGLYWRQAGAVMVRNPFFSRFRVIKIFAWRTSRHPDFQTDQGTHLLIESLGQRLKTWPYTIAQRCRSLLLYSFKNGIGLKKIAPI